MNGGDDGVRTRLAGQQVAASRGNCLKIRSALPPIWQPAVDVSCGMFARGLHGFSTRAHAKESRVGRDQTVELLITNNKLAIFL